MLLLPYSVAAQDPTGTIEGTVIDATMSVVPGARVTASQADTRFTREAVAGADGFFRLSLLPVGEYSVTVEAPKFSTAVQERVPVTVSQTVRLSVQLELSSVTDVVTVSGGVQLVDTSTNALGRVITGRELVDLPLNGRNFTQLGLLQTGVAPLTAGVATAGGSLRQGQAYAVNGMRPEQNIYLVDGAQNMNRMDGGFAVRIPVDAIAEFRILTQSAPPEYGGTGGATTSVVTRGGSNRFNGSVYDFIRNDVFDARNFFSREVEPLNQNQFGATFGGPLQTNRTFFFGYYEGFRNKQGITTTATVPTAQERVGDFSALSTPLLNLAAGGVPFPGNQLPPNAINPVARNVVNLYPLGNVSPSIYRETLIGRNEIDQIGGRVDFNASASDQLFGRYSVLGRPQHQPGVGPRHGRSGLSDARRSHDAFRTGVEHPNFLAVTHELSAGDVAQPQIPVRPAAQPAAAAGARLRLRLGECPRSGSAVLQREWLLADRWGHHRPEKFDADDIRGPRRGDVDARRASGQGRR